MSRTSQWEVIRRCLRMIAHLERGPSTRDELVALAYPDVPTSAALKRFENDIQRLRDSLDVDVGYDQENRVYELHQARSVPLLDLPKNALKGLAFLADTFEVGTPQYQDVQELCDVVSALLTSERRDDLKHARTALGLDLRQRDQDPISDNVWHSLETAHLQQRLVQFEYRSPHQDDQQPRRHVVEARKLYFDTVRSHFYLWGYCRSVQGPNTHWIPNRFFRYRVGRIASDSVEILPTRFPSALPPIPRYDVIYCLAPKVARLGISQHFENTRVETNEDDSVTVYADTDDIFYAARTLLYYGPNCLVLGGSEMLREFTQIVRDMAAHYNI